MSKVIVCDFDDTICEWAYPDMGSPKQGVKEAFQKMKDMGYEIHICSCRTNHEVTKYHIDRQVQIREMKKYLEDNRIPYDKVLDNDKPTAHVYIDDRAIGYRDDWEKVIEELEDM